MRVVVGSDHAGYTLRQALGRHLQQGGHQVVDVGCAKPESCDYPDFAHAAAEVMVADEANFGVLVCGSGQGIAMSANRFVGLRAALCREVDDAVQARQHNNANIVCLGQNKTAEALAKQIVDAFLATAFEGDTPDGARHARRVKRIDALATQERQR